MCMADKEKGWVLLYRSIRDSWVWKSKPFDTARAWVDLILDANHDEGKFYKDGNLITIHRGQTWTSYRVLGERWGWSKDKVARFLDALERDSMITINATPLGTLLTIVNYSKFQDVRDSKPDAERTHTGRRTDGTNKDKRITKEGENKSPLSEVKKPAPEMSEEEWERMMTDGDL